MSDDRGRAVRRVMSDSVWSIAGLVLMNAVAQFAVYPVWNRELGNERYGTILYLISAMNILAISMGVACNYARMRQSAEGPTRNSIYNRLMWIVSGAAVPYAGLIYALSGTEGGSAAEAALFMALTILTMWRFYADVEYRLSLNYRGYFLYYLAVSAGYGIGILLFLRTGLWPLALIPGEAAGLAAVAWKGSIFRRDSLPGDEEKRQTVKAVAVLLGTNVVNNLVFNGDRVLLSFLMNGTAVTIYYQASLLGKTMTLITTPLNSVLMGYLARYKGGLSRRMMNAVTAAAAAAVPAVTAACVLASHILIRMLYPQNYELVREWFWLANAAQVAYFVSGVVSTLLLRYGRIRYQMYINLVYAGLFAALCIPGTLLGGMKGFCWSLLAVCLLRLAYVIFLGYRTAVSGEAAE